MNCQICMESMQESDIANPLLCTTQCGFNMCLNCVEHLVESSNCGYEEASDGNMHVKVRLQCPNCRGNLSHTIGDTLLLRKALVLNARWKKFPDSELTSTELRTKYSLSPKEIEDARQRLSDVKASATTITTNTNENSSDSSSRVNSPFPSGQRNNGTSINHILRTSNGIPVDEAFFAGLGFAMSNDEKFYVTELMASGDTQKLALAAQILDEISKVIRRGYTTNSTQNYQNPNMNTPAEQRALASSMSEEERKERLQFEKIAKHRNQHPLPSRLPRYIELNANFDVYAKRFKILKFEDEGWDGSVADAFARMSMGHQNLNNDVEIDDNSESSDESDEEDGIEQNSRIHNLANIQTENNRVIVMASRGQAAKRGVRKGDEVSFINGEEFKGSAEKLREIIHKFCISDTINTFSIVFNAGKRTATALRLRAMIEDS